MTLGNYVIEGYVFTLLCEKRIQKKKGDEA